MSGWNAKRHSYCPDCPGFAAASGNGGEARSRAAESHPCLSDDEATIAAALAKFPDSKGYRGNCAFNGQQSIDMIANDPADSVIRDLSLSMTDALTVARRIGGRGDRISVVIICAVYPDGNLAGNRFMSKSCDFDCIFLVVVRVLDKMHPHQWNNRSTPTSALSPRMKGIEGGFAKKKSDPSALHALASDARPSLITRQASGGLVRLSLSGLRPRRVRFEYRTVCR